MKDQVKPDEEAKKAPAGKGRNATDNFNEGGTDDYGVDYSKPDAEEELQAREEIKGGTGQKGKDRNSNDNFSE